ncbi:hypothetical protein [Nevskia soli]|uniref:hypothetical protein n=1 Tax=Nevskia soli TaxID=418856 RepID=UPI001C5C98E8|nr:hypothetical protein [Nevskia soli]
MTVTLRLNPETEADLLARANAEGLNVSDFVQNLVLERISIPAEPSLPAYDLPPQEWVRQFEAWTCSHAGRNLPVLSDEAISRESIYADRGLLPTTRTAGP